MNRFMPGAAGGKIRVVANNEAGKQGGEEKEGEKKKIII